MIRFFRQIIFKVIWAKDGLWQVDQVNECSQYQLFDISIIKRSLDSFTYYGLQIVLWKLLICISHPTFSKPRE